MGNIDSSVFEYNKYDSNMAWAINLDDDSDGNVIRYNYSTGHTTAGKGFAAIWTDSTGTCDNNIVHHNVINGDLNGIAIGDDWGDGSNGTFTGIEIYNNIYYGAAGGNGVAIYDDETVDVMRNNILYAGAGGLGLYDDGGSATLTTNTNNLYYIASGNVVLFGGSG
ncbi:MAG: hypothetical protein GWO08_11285, partial [Gammaproteobacteria bacterium]|nr:hypothetical protein [Gammaproteobacteria bacterium]NIU14331.1 hypothetical protein [candidate division Zixibacteria bacterium]NIV06402.1 hypothetical protein [candidate division Zixibacteria bacterium]